MDKHPAPQRYQFAVIATDVAIFALKDEALHIRLIRVDRPPHFPGMPGMPGGLIEANETAEEAAKRVLVSKAGIDPEKPYIEQLYTFSDPLRDPRGRVVAVAYLALLPWEALDAQEREDTKEAFWLPIKEAKRLAYDHDEMLKVALERLRSRVTYTTLIGRLMPEEFTLTELEKAYESILSSTLDKRNFRKKILKLGILKELPKKRTGGRYRPAQLYRFASKKVSEIEVI